MFRICLATLVVAFGAMSAQAIVVDGDVSDWPAGLLHTDPSNDGNTNGYGVVQCEILRYGATVVGDRFYAVLEMAKPVGDFNSPVKTWSSGFIDTDNSAGTQLLNLGNYGDGTLGGTDTDLEWGRFGAEGNGADPDYSFWGYGDDVYGLRPADAGGSGVAGGTHAVNGSTNAVFEWSAPVTSILAAAAFSGSGATGPQNVWKVHVGQSANAVPGDPSGAGWAQYDWGNEGGDTGITVTAMLAGDANISGTVNVADLTKLLNNYNQSGKTWADGDFDGDGTVNVADLTALLNNYNKTNGAVVVGLNSGTPVPEPSSIVLLATLSALMGAWVIRRRNG